jgi:nucleotide-binding universal stress UspA family protein
MTLRTILVPVRGDDRGEGLLDHALALGQRSNAHIEVVHCRARPEDMLPFGVFLPASMREQIKSAAGNMADVEETKLRPLFDAYAETHGLEIADTPPWPQDRVSISWRERTGKQPSIVALYGRLADLIVVPQPDRAQNFGVNTLEAALFSTGRPVVMCPAGSAGTIGDHVAVAWNGSAESSRAVAMAMPVLAGASAVTIVAVGAEVPDDMGPNMLAAYLASHGIGTEVVARGEGKIAQTLLAECQARGADLLVMGAYGQSRQLEMVMGGVTQHIVDHAAVPVLMSH